VTNPSAIAQGENRRQRPAMPRDEFDPRWRALLSSAFSDRNMHHTAHTIETYDQIATDYHLIATPEHRAWLEGSMREFHSRLPGKHVLVAGCGEGRDSRYLQTLGAHVISFDLSEGMLLLARASDPAGTYLSLDLRQAQKIEQAFDGIWACACLYHNGAGPWRKRN